jgi:hypothetical protein
MKTQMAEIKEHPERCRSSLTLVMWTPESGEVKVQALTEQGGIRLSQTLRPNQARKLARVLLKAANQAEGRPTPRMWSDDEDDGPVVVEM